MNKRIKQKYGRRYRREKIYNLCDYLARDICTNLKLYEHITPAVPSCFCHPYDDCKEEKWLEAREKWHTVLRNMIWSFDEIAKNYPNKPNDDPQEIAAYWKRVDNGLRLFVDYFTSLWF